MPDTHALVWYFRDDPKLSARAAGIIEAAERGEYRLLVPTIVLAELTTLSERKMPELSMREVLRKLEGMATVTIVPFDYRVFKEMVLFPAALELHDRIIAGTARHFGAALLTRDPTLSAVAEVVW